MIKTRLWLCQWGTDLGGSIMVIWCIQGPPMKCRRKGDRAHALSLCPFPPLSNYLTASSFRLCSCVSAALLSTAVHFPINCLTIPLKAESKNKKNKYSKWTQMQSFHVHFSQIFTVYTESESLLRHLKRRKKLVSKVLSGCNNVKILDFFLIQ